jgi:hypothetical protein
MPTDWKSSENLERLVAALIASNGGKVSCLPLPFLLHQTVMLNSADHFLQVDNTAVARYFNETYDAIENRTRVFKKAAQVLVTEAEAAGRMEMSMKKSAAGSKKTATPKKNSTLTPDSEILCVTYCCLDFY